jgi:hypothetical protein
VFKGLKNRFLDYSYLYVMQKFLAIAFSTLYILATAGIMVSKHSCCGQVVDMHWTDETDACCDHGDHQCASTTEDCCSFDLMYFSIDDEHRTTNVEWSFSQALPVKKSTFDRGSHFVESLRIQFPDSPDPPSIPIYLKSCSLVLYA